ncbi:membrane-flanked domain protein [Tessaracoccus flavus]|uniref:Membrane-flanked domain protein n=2 Tax=Tessaracoccus flavus TaxID=1610493 RepID=A0A1Q2CEJ6_9ACTN|nr:PH domain-containing protein [Tessaracoccus flavus]AQP44521.1 membrane-flanked domain protein [Tessaracoccus flavus]SDY72022.1 PH domain-containing protein [Tessaracoccus flavus]
MGVMGRLLEPQIEAHLLEIEGERVIDEVRKHWAATFWWYCLAGLSLPLFVSMVWARGLFWIPLALGLAALSVGLWKIHVAYMDRFVITNMRVFRVNGVFNTNLATMPMSRILDISMKQPFLGQLCGYGHFVFETAAQDQGLRDITFVGDPQRRDLIIQRVIARAGLRTKMQMDDEDSDGS